MQMEGNHTIWIEKYRPRRLDDIVGQNDIVVRLKSYVKTGNLPHLLFTGSAGIGKTTAAVALARGLLAAVFGFSLSVFLAAYLATMERLESLLRQHTWFTEGATGFEFLTVGQWLQRYPGRAFEAPATQAASLAGEATPSTGIAAASGGSAVGEPAVPRAGAH